MDRFALQSLDQSPPSGLFEPGFANRWRNLTVQSFLGYSNWPGLATGVAVVWEQTVERESSPPPESSTVDRSVNWKRLSVNTFLSQENWQGDSFSAPRPQQVKAPPVKVVVPPSWACLGVADFFAQVNWDHTPQFARDPGQPIPVLSLSLPVAQFMAILPWEGKLAIAALPVSVPPAVTSSPEITLANLSDLF
jgi:hypothetical protein